LGIIVLLLIWVAASYNIFVKMNNSVKEAFSTMDVYLKKRWDLIPSLVETVKGYAAHESGVFEKVIQLRDSNYVLMSANDKISTNERLSSVLPSLFAVAEGYPELKANENFLDLSRQLSRIEDEIANSRKYYNATVKRINTQIELFPSNIIAGMFGFRLYKMFETVAEEKANVKVEI
jgi:LemA protein